MKMSSKEGPWAGDQKTSLRKREKQNFETFKFFLLKGFKERKAAKNKAEKIFRMKETVWNVKMPFIPFKNWKREIEEEIEAWKVKRDWRYIGN